MLTRRERLAALACVLLALAAVLMGCASPRAPEPLPKVLPHYPCTKQDGGQTVYYECDVHDWLAQQSQRGKP